MNSDDDVNQILSAMNWTGEELVPTPDFVPKSPESPQPAEITVRTCLTHYNELKRAKFSFEHMLNAYKQTEEEKLKLEQKNAEQQLSLPPQKPARNSQSPSEAKKIQMLQNLMKNTYDNFDSFDNSEKTDSVKSDTSSTKGSSKRNWTGRRESAKSVAGSFLNRTIIDLISSYPDSKPPPDVFCGQLLPIKHLLRETDNAAEENEQV